VEVCGGYNAETLQCNVSTLGLVEDVCYVEVLVGCVLCGGGCGVETHSMRLYCGYDGETLQCNVSTFLGGVALFYVSSTTLKRGVVVSSL